MQKINKISLSLDSLSNRIRKLIEQKNLHHCCTEEMSVILLTPFRHQPHCPLSFQTPAEKPAGKCPWACWWSFESTEGSFVVWSQCFPNYNQQYNSIYEFCHTVDHINIYLSGVLSAQRENCISDTRKGQMKRIKLDSLCYILHRKIVLSVYQVWKCEKFYNKRITIFSNYLYSWRTEKLGK